MEAHVTQIFHKLRLPESADQHRRVRAGGSTPNSTPGSYLLGVKFSDKQLAAVRLRRHDWHGEWNYTVPPTAA